MLAPQAHDSALTQLLPALFARTTIGIAIYDLEGRYVSVNPAYAAINGCSAEGHVGRSVGEVIPTLADALRDGIATVRSTDAIVELELSGMRHGGQLDERHWVSVLHPLHHDGELRFVGEMLRDVTARRVVELQKGEALDLERVSREEAQQQRDFLRAVLQNAPMGLSVWKGPQHRLVAISDFALRLLDRPREAVINRPLSEIAPEAFTLVEDVFRRVYEGETVTMPEFAVPLPDGRTVWTYSLYAPMRDADGAPLGVIALSLDTSEQHRVQAVIDAQKQILESVAAGATLPDTLRLIVDVVGEFSPDRGIPSILLLDADGRRLRHGAAPQLPDAYNAAIDGLVIGPTVGSCGTAAYRRERIIVTDVQADPLWKDFRALAAEHGLRACWSTPIIGSAGRVLGTFAIYYREPHAPSDDEVTLVDLLVRTTAFVIEWSRADEERRAILEAERVARIDAEAANRSKDEFVATLSHELRTPLNAILGWTRLLRAGQVAPDATGHALEAIERNTRAQAQLVEDLLDISRIITGKLRLDVRSVDLMAVVAAAVDAIRPAADAKNIRVQKVLDPRAGPIAGDPDRLQQVIWNLLSNAIKFTPKGGRVQVRVERVNSHVEISVSDTGIGIPDDVLPYVFDRFRQGDRAGGKMGGLGLGLAIARHLVELHGGTISAASDGVGRGATLHINLPLAPVQPQRAAEELHPTAPASVMAADLPRLPAMRLLVVDDDDDGREVVTRLLAAAGAEVRSVASVATAMHMLQTWKPDVIVSDIEMPDEDGYAFISRLRHLPDSAARQIPAIALTAYARVEDRIKALAAGFQMHVSKPVEPAELIAVVNSLFPGRTPPGD